MISIQHIKLNQGYFIKNITIFKISPNLYDKFIIQKISCSSERTKMKFFLLFFAIRGFIRVQCSFFLYDSSILA